MSNITTDINKSLPDIPLEIQEEYDDSDQDNNSMDGMPSMTFSQNPKANDNTKHFTEKISHHIVKMFEHDKDVTKDGEVITKTLEREINATISNGNFITIGNDQREKI
ncbi:16037_t:CDS:2, partial [Gigaspora margarita]